MAHDVSFLSVADLLILSKKNAFTFLAIQKMMNQKLLKMPEKRLVLMIRGIVSWNGHSFIILYKKQTFEPWKGDGYDRYKFFILCSCENKQN